MSGMFEMFATSLGDNDYEVVLFAESQERADLLFLVIEHHLDLLPEGWVGDEHDTWLTVGLVRHGREAQKRRVEGVGHYTAEGWIILPLDYEKIGIDPPPDRIA